MPHRPFLQRAFRRDAKIAARSRSSPYSLFVPLLPKQRAKEFTVLPPCFGSLVYAKLFAATRAGVNPAEAGIVRVNIRPKFEELPATAGSAGYEIARNFLAFVEITTRRHGLCIITTSSARTCGKGLVRLSRSVRVIGSCNVPFCSIVLVPHFLCGIHANLHGDNLLVVLRSTFEARGVDNLHDMARPIRLQPLRALLRR